MTTRAEDIIESNKIVVDSTKELSDDEIAKLLETQGKVIDTVVVGGEEFYRNSYMGIGKIGSFVIGCYGDRYFEASQRECHMWQKKQSELIKKGISPIQKVMTSLGYKLDLE